MYEDFFNLRVKPFDLVPDPRFIYPSTSHKKALTYLDYAIRERAGFILLTGEVGSGKTTLIRDLIERKYERVVLAKVFNTKVDSQQLLCMINDDFGLKVQGKDKVALMRDLNDFLLQQFAKGNHPILILDEAQNLSPDLLEEVRMLSNLESSQSKLLQIILVGQPELRDTLAAPGLMQLRQRISVSCHLNSLTRDEVQRYINHRMQVAGNPQALAFAPEALELVYRCSRGVPRLINIVCDFIMLSAFADGTTTARAELVQDVIADLDFERHFWGEQEKDRRETEVAKAVLAEEAATEVREIVTRVPAALQVMCDSIHNMKGEILAQVNRHEAQVTELRRRVENLSGLVDSMAVPPPPQQRTPLPGFARRLMDGISGYGGRK